MVGWLVGWLVAWQYLCCLTKLLECFFIWAELPSTAGLQPIYPTDGTAHTDSMLQTCSTCTWQPFRWTAPTSPVTRGQSRSTSHCKYMNALLTDRNAHMTHVTIHVYMVYMEYMCMYICSIHIVMHISRYLYTYVCTYMGIHMFVRMPCARKCAHVGRAFVCRCRR